MQRGTTNKEQLIYPKNGEASTFTRFAVANYRPVKLPPENLNGNLLLTETRY